MYWVSETQEGSSLDFAVAHSGARVTEHELRSLVRELDGITGRTEPARLGVVDADRIPPQMLPDLAHSGVPVHPALSAAGLESAIRARIAGVILSLDGMFDQATAEEAYRQVGADLVRRWKQEHGLPLDKPGW